MERCFGVWFSFLSAAFRFEERDSGFQSGYCCRKWRQLSMWEGVFWCRIQSFIRAHSTLHREHICGNILGDVA